MNKNFWKDKIYECECHGEGLVLSQVECDSNKKNPENHPIFIYLAFISQGFRSSFPLNFRQKIRWCWNIIKTGKPFVDMVILNKNNAQNLASDLLTFANFNNKKKKGMTVQRLIKELKKYDKRMEVKVNSNWDMTLTGILRVELNPDGDTVYIVDEA